MRITITTTDTALTFMRRAGYGYQKEGSGELAFVRRVSGSPFPRFHAYVMEGVSSRVGTPNQSLQLAAPTLESGRAGSLQLVINLHVDQKAPTYQQGRAHAGEYDGPLVEQEAARLRGLAQSGNSQRDDAEKPTQGGSPSGGKGFWGKLFG
jgi:hypothetical protein